MTDRPIEHRSKKGRIHTGRVWRLYDGLLSCDAGGGHREIPVGDIEAVHLTFAPTRFEFDRYACHLKPKGRSWEIIYSIWDAGLAHAEDHGDTYRRLVRSLVEQVAEANPGARVRAGEPGSRYWFELVLLILVFASLAAAVSILGLAWNWSTAVMAMCAIVALPFALMWARRNRPRNLNPASLPDMYLPPVPVENHRSKS